jgi:hypothetical protein
VCRVAIQEGPGVDDAGGSPWRTDPLETEPSEVGVMKGIIALLAFLVFGIALVLALGNSSIAFRLPPL